MHSRRAAPRSRDGRTSPGSLSRRTGCRFARKHRALRLSRRRPSFATASTGCALAMARLSRLDIMSRKSRAPERRSPDTRRFTWSRRTSFAALAPTARPAAEGPTRRVPACLITAAPRSTMERLRTRGWRSPGQLIRSTSSSSKSRVPDASSSPTGRASGSAMASKTGFRTPRSASF